jgi:hypothetical protein
LNFGRQSKFEFGGKCYLDQLDRSRSSGRISSKITINEPRITPPTQKSTTTLSQRP